MLMKYVIAIVKPHKLEDVRAALTKISIEGMTVSDVKGFGRQKGHSEVYRGAEYKVDFVPKVKIELAVEASRVAAVVEAIRNSARTDRIGDGKIFVLDLGEAMRVRTGETGVAAL
jgi:nitrogen regulatory protein P-II 2